MIERLDQVLVLVALRFREEQLPVVDRLADARLAKPQQTDTELGTRLARLERPGVAIRGEMTEQLARQARGGRIESADEGLEVSCGGGSSATSEG